MSPDESLVSLAMGASICGAKRVGRTSPFRATVSAVGLVVLQYAYSIYIVYKPITLYSVIWLLMNIIMNE